MRGARDRRAGLCCWLSPAVCCCRMCWFCLCFCFNDNWRWRLTRAERGASQSDHHHFVLVICRSYSYNAKSIALFQWHIISYVLCIDISQLLGWQSDQRFYALLSTFGISRRHRRDGCIVYSCMRCWLSSNQLTDYLLFNFTLFTVIKVVCVNKGKLKRDPKADHVGLSPPSHPSL